MPALLQRPRAVFAALALATAASSAPSAAGAQTFVSDALASTPVYDVAIRLSPESHRMDVRGTLTIPPAPQPQPQLELYLSDLMRDVRVEVVEPAENAGQLDGVPSSEGGHVRRWVFRPNRPFAANARIRLRFAYDGGEGTAFTYALGQDGSFAGPGSFWYPRSGRGVGTLTFTVPHGYTVLSTGMRRSSSAEEANGRFTFINNVPARFAFAAAKYTVASGAGPVPMHLYMLHPKPDAARTLDAAARVLATLTTEFGPYPYAEFSIAEVPAEPARQAGFGGASMTGFMLTTSLDAFNVAFYGHEMSHQWWGSNLVSHSGSPRGDYMLDEGLAQYGSLRVVEALEGPAAAERYRRTGYPAYVASQCGYGYLLSTDSGLDRPLAKLDTGYGHELANAKGFLVWDLLARTVGLDRFRSVLHDITRTYAFQAISWDAFLAAIQHASSDDLSWFFAQWFERTGAPDWHLAWKQSGAELHGVITQAAPFYRADIDVALHGAGGAVTAQEVRVEGARTEFVATPGFAVESVELDPHFLVLHWLPELHAGAAARGPALRAFQLSDAGKLGEAERELTSALARIPQLDAYGARYWTEYALAYVFVAKKDWTSARQHLDAALAAPTRDADTLPYVYWRYAQVAKNLHDDAALRWAVNATISADAAIGGQGTGAPDLARALLAAQ